MVVRDSRADMLNLRPEWRPTRFWPVRNIVVTKMITGQSWWSFFLVSLKEISATQLIWGCRLVERERVGTPKNEII
jgi:hypothetical protein